MRIPSGKTDQVIFFVALDSVDYITRKTGLSAFTVYRSRNGGTATVYTTPTIAELSAANMPGVYALTVDEDTTIASTSDSEEVALHITCSGMAPVTRTIELYRPVATAAALATAQTGIDDIPTNAELATALAGADDATLAALATLSGKFTFSVAGVVDAHVKYVAGEQVTGSGTVGDPWGPTP